MYSRAHTLHGAIAPTSAWCSPFLVDFFFMPAAAGLVAEDIARAFPLPFNERRVVERVRLKKKSLATISFGEEVSNAMSNRDWAGAAVVAGAAAVACWLYSRSRELEPLEDAGSQQQAKGVAMGERSTSTARVP